MIHITDNHDALLDYLYEEGDPAERLRIATHLQECAACSVAVLEFQNVRGMLSDWTPPAAPSSDSGSSQDRRTVAERERGSGSARSLVVGVGPRHDERNGRGPQVRAGLGPLSRPRPPLLFVSGMAVSQLNVDYRMAADGGLRSSCAGTLRRRSHSRTEWIMLPPERAAVRMTRSMRRLRRDSSKNASSADTEDLLQRVRAMIDQSEQRQQRELALRLSQVAREVETQHQADVLRIQQDFGRQQERPWIIS